MASDSLLVSPAPTTTVEQPIRKNATNAAGRWLLAQRADEAQGAAAEPVECDPEERRRQALEREQERDKAEALARALTSSLRAKLDALQSARTKHSQALDQQREKADVLARDLAALQAGLDPARMAGKEAAQSLDLSIRQTEALEQERDKAHQLARELSIIGEELEAARIAVSKALQAGDADMQRDQALAIEKDKAENLTCAVASLRIELEKVRIAGSEAGSTSPAAAEHAQALDRERDRADTLARDLSSARAEAAKAAAAEAEQRLTLEKELQQQRDAAQALERELILLRGERDRARKVAQESASSIEAAEQKQALERERNRSDALAHELASARQQINERSTRLAATYAEILQVRGQLDVANRQLNRASRPLTFLDGLPEWVATSLSAVTERPPRAPPDEQRLLALATILLRRTDISAARPLLEQAARSGSARAAFMLAETYDRRFLRSWRARRIWGNSSKALELYEMAQAGGIEDARKRIERLHNASVRSSRAQFR